MAELNWDLFVIAIVVICASYYVMRKDNDE